MEHIGIDLGSRTSHICIIDSEGAKVRLEDSVRTSELDAWLGQQPPSRVVIETCTESFAVADRALAWGHEVRVVPAAVVRQLGVGYRGVKNDRRDARVLSRASLALGEELPSVHIPSKTAREVQRLLTLRLGLVRMRVKHSNAIKSILRQDLRVLSGGKPEGLPARLRRDLADTKSLEMLEPMLCSLEATTAAIKVYDKRIAALSESDERVRRLKTVPGIGPVVGAAFVNALDDSTRFPSGAHLASYLGLTPGENTTGGKQRFTGITHAGKARIRTLLIQACWSHVRVCPDSPLARRYHRLAMSKPKQVAIVATARRLACILFAMLRDRTPYNPSLGASRHHPDAAASLAEALQREFASTTTSPAMRT